MQKSISCSVLLLLMARLIASEPIAIESGEMRYQGREIVLEGGVAIDQAHGHVTASTARIHRREGQRDSFQEIELHRGVVVRLRGGGILSCDHAFFNSDTFQGRFSTDPRVGRVHYVEDRERKLSILCNRLDIEGALKGSGIRQIEAFGAVEISHGDGLWAAAHRVTYLACQHGSRRLLELAESNAWKSQRAPLLTLPTASPVWEPSLLHEEASSCEVIILNEEVHFQQAGLGFLESDGTLLILRRPHNGKQVIDQVMSLGTTRFDFANPEDGSMRSLTCYGQLVVDNQRHRIELTSPKGGEQICYADERGQVYANEMVIHYRSTQEGVRGSRIELTGNVRLQSGDLFSDSPLPLQLAVADRMEYDPDREIMTLEASPGRSVLFLDETQDTRVSARKVCYDRRHNAIEGFGDVRFSLSDPEIGKLKERFKP